MSGWELFTWISAFVLAFGSIAVFLAFLFDLREMRRRLKSGDDEDHPSRDFKPSD
jgi:hypothetical protein